MELRGYDLQTTNLLLLITNKTSDDGLFSLVGNKLKYTPEGISKYSNTRLSAAGTTSKDELVARVSDGTNASPPVKIRVLSILKDSILPSDGLPDIWMTRYFGHNDPRAADKSRSTDDRDADGLNNLQEYLGGSNPTNALSVQQVTMLSGDTLQWWAKAYELYEVESTMDLTNWVRVRTPLIPTNAVHAVLTNIFGTNILAVAAEVPSTHSHLFFRIQKVP